MKQTREAFTEEHADYCRRGFLSSQTVIVACRGDRKTHDIGMEVYRTQYGGDIELQNGYEIDTDLCYFVITVTSDESTVSLWFTFSGLTVMHNPPQIIF